jgi:hypothetical protein
MESGGRSHVKAQNGAVEGLWHLLDEEQDSDPNPNQSDQSDPHQSEKGTQIWIIVFRFSTQFFK